MTSLLNFFFLIVLFFIDIFLIGITGFPFLHSVLCFTIITFLYSSFCPLFYGSFLLLGFEYFIAFDIFGLNYLYLIPLFALLKTSTNYLSSKQITAAIVLVFSIFCQANWQKPVPHSSWFQAFQPQVYKP